MAHLGVSGSGSLCQDDCRDYSHFKANETRGPASKVIHSYGRQVGGGGWQEASVLYHMGSHSCA